MNNEKKEGRSRQRNFVICDVRERYSENLLRILTEKIPGEYQFHLFHDISRLKEFSEKTQIGILLIAEEYERSDRQEVSADRKFVFTGKKDSVLAESEIPLFRYQSSEKIMKRIMENGEAEEREDGRYDFRKGKTGAYRVREDSKKVMRGLIGVYSPIHRIGKTKFALRLGRQIAEKVPVLYLNLESYSGGNYYFPEDTGSDMGDLLYYMRQDKINLGLKLSTMVGQSEGVDYIMPMRYERDLRDVTSSEWKELIDIILEKCIYETIILDLGDSVDGLYDILRKCSRIYTLYIEEGAAEAKLIQYEENLRNAGYADVLSRTVKRRAGRAKNTAERSEVRR